MLVCFIFHDVDHWHPTGFISGRQSTKSKFHFFAMSSVAFHLGSTKASYVLLGIDILDNWFANDIWFW